MGGALQEYVHWQDQHLTEMYDAYASDSDTCTCLLVDVVYIPKNRSVLFGVIFRGYVANYVPSLFTSVISNLVLLRANLHTKNTYLRAS